MINTNWIELILFVCVDGQNFESFDDVAAKVDKMTGGEGINLLINNAAIMEQPQNSIFHLTKETFLKHLEINTVSPMLLAKVSV